MVGGSNDRMLVQHPNPMNSNRELAGGRNLRKTAIVGVAAVTLLLSGCDATTRRYAAIGAGIGAAGGLILGATTSVGIVPGTLIGAGVGAGAGAIYANRGRLAQAAGGSDGDTQSSSATTSAGATSASRSAAQRSVFANTAEQDTGTPTQTSTVSEPTQVAAAPAQQTYAPPPQQTYIPPAPQTYAPAPAPYDYEVTTYGSPNRPYGAPAPYGGQAPRGPSTYGPDYGRYPSLTETVARTQTGLALLGYNPGPANNVRGDLLENSIRQYQRDYRLRVDGLVTADLARHIESQTRGQAY